MHCMSILRLDNKPPPLNITLYICMVYLVTVHCMSSVRSDSKPPLPSMNTWSTWWLNYMYSYILAVPPSPLWTRSLPGDCALLFQCTVGQWPPPSMSAWSTWWLYTACPGYGRTMSLLVPPHRCRSNIPGCHQTTNLNQSINQTINQLMNALKKLVQWPLQVKVIVHLK